MKKIKSLLIFSVLALSLSSCDDAIEVIQDGELSPEATFRTVADLQAFLVGDIYTRVDNTNEIGFTSVFTDEVSIGVNNGGQEKQLHRFFLNPADEYAGGLWLQNYALINRINRLIEASEIITVKDTEQATFNSILAQARTLRAYAYLQLVSYFSTDISNDAALGVMLYDYVPELTDTEPRVSNGEIFALVESDLTFASANLINPTGVNAYKNVTVNLINSIYARMYLYRKNYPLAKQYAQAVVSTSGVVLTPGTPYVAANFYGTASTNPYRRIWADLAQGEVIFSAARPVGGTGGNIGTLFYFNTSSATGGAFLEMGRNLYNALSSSMGGTTAGVPNDIRRLAFIDPTESPNPDYLTIFDYINLDVLPIDKYPGKSGSGAALRNDLKIFRLSEMYFILAECAVVDNDLTGAAGYIKNIRDARSRVGARPLPVYANVTQAWADILDERRLEFCFEGHRYLDIKRLGVLANKSIDRNPTDDDIKTLPTTISNTDYRFTLPIPQNEKSGNPTIVQNPGYNN